MTVDLSNETTLYNQVLLIILRLKLSLVEILHPDWRNPPQSLI